MDDEHLLTDLWLKVISDWSSYNKDHKTDLVRKGVPAHLRPQIWKLLASTQQVTQQTSESYRNMLKRSSKDERQIQRDIARTYPENDYFRDEAGPGQEGLFNVIKAYSLHDEEVGYCQGIAFIVGLLLLQLSEEDSFMLLCEVMQKYRMREIYKPTMAELVLCHYQLECLVQEQLPELYVHFQKQNFDTSMYSTPWFLTLFTSNMPLNLAYRVMDLFLSEGLEMIFRLSVAILQICKVDLLRLDMEGLSRYFQKEMPSRLESDPDYLIKCSCLIKYDSKKMQKLCKEYTTTKVKTKEQEEAIENRRLRTENRILQDRIKILEGENGNLAQKVIESQLKVAQEAEDKDIIKHELRQLKNSDKENVATIERLQLRIAETDKLINDRLANHSADLKSVIADLLHELEGVKVKKAENDDLIYQLQKKITEQELFIKSLRETVPEDPVAQLQEQLSAVKCREAEANSAFEGLRSKFNELQTLWFEHLQQVHGVNITGGTNSQHNSLDQSCGGSPPNSATLNPLGGDSNSLTINHQSLNSSTQLSQPPSLSSSIASSNPISKFFNNSVIKRGSSSTGANSNSGHLDDQQELQRVKQELLTLKLQEAKSVAEMKRLTLREMELETEIKLQRNMYRRKEEECKRIETELKTGKEELEKVTRQLKEEKRKLEDFECKRSADSVLYGVSNAENIRIIGELKRKISTLEIELEEINAAKIVVQSGSEPKDASEFHHRMEIQQLESFRLDASNARLHDMERRNQEREREGSERDECA